MMKKVLLITYFWPPAGGPGVQRVLKFAKYLPEFGWQPVVLTVSNGEYPALDTSMENEVPPDTHVVKTKSIEPFALFKKFTGRRKEDKISTYLLTEKKAKNILESILKWVRINIVLPDAKIGWLPFAVREGIRLVRSEKIDLIFSSSPPHTVQLIAANIARKTGIKWIADFRDPWLEIVYYQNLKRFLLSQKVDRMLEKKVLLQADRVICISESIRSLFKSKLNHNKFDVLPNGFDARDFESIDGGKEDIFTITYTGVLSDERIPYGLIPAIKRMKTNAMDFQLRLVGAVCAKFIKLLDAEGLLQNTRIIDYVPHTQALGYLKKSSVLLLVIDDVPQNQGFLSGKIFDYLGSKIPVLAFGPVDGDAAKILNDTSSGTMIDYHDSDQAYDWLVQAYHSRQEWISKYKFNVEAFERKHLTGQLVKIFDKTANPTNHK